MMPPEDDTALARRELRVLQMRELADAVHAWDVAQRDDSKGVIDCALGQIPVYRPYQEEARLMNRFVADTAEARHMTASAAKLTVLGTTVPPSLVDATTEAAGRTHAPLAATLTGIAAARQAVASAAAANQRHQDVLDPLSTAEAAARWQVADCADIALRAMLAASADVPDAPEALATAYTILNEAMTAKVRTRDDATTRFANAQEYFTEQLSSCANDTLIIGIRALSDQDRKTAVKDAIKAGNTYSDAADHIERLTRISGSAVDGLVSHLQAWIQAETTAAEEATNAAQTFIAFLNDAGLTVS